MNDYERVVFRLREWVWDWISAIFCAKSISGVVFTASAAITCSKGVKCTSWSCTAVSNDHTLIKCSARICQLGFGWPSFEFLSHNSLRWKGWSNPQVLVQQCLGPPKSHIFHVVLFWFHLLTVPTRNRSKWGTKQSNLEGECTGTWPFIHGLSLDLKPLKPLKMSQI